MSKEFMETLNLKTSIKISGKEFDFELYTIQKGYIKEIKFNNEVFALNNGVKQSNETTVTDLENNDPEPLPIIEEGNVEDLIVDMINGSTEENKIKPMVKPLVKSADKTKKSFNTLFDAEDIIASPGKYNSCALYKPILDEILNNITPVFSGRDISNIILDIYKKIGRNISMGSAYVYSSSYRRYMLDHGLIVVKDEVKRVYEINEVTTVKEKKEIPENTSEVFVIPESKKTKSPNNTMLFMNWLEKRDDAFFTLGDVVKDLSLSKERSLEIVQHQLDEGNIQRINKWEFTKTKNAEDELIIPVKKNSNSAFQP